MKSRIGWILLIFAGVLLLVPGLWVFMSLTAKKVHPDSQSIPSVTNSQPLPKWVGAAEQARQIVRTSASENNLAGLSVAVGIDGEIVWAEGFGFADVESGLPAQPQVSDRNRLHSTHVDRNRPALGRRPAEVGR